MHFLRRLPPLFFLGLFPVVCLLWLWADSRVAYSSWTYCSGPQFHFTATSACSSLQLSTAKATERRPPEEMGKLMSVDPHRTGPMGSFLRHPMPSAWANLPLFPAAQSEEEWYDVHSGVMLEHTRHVPIWQILLCYLPPWLGLSLWQALRRKIKLEARQPLAKSP